MRKKINWRNFGLHYAIPFALIIFIMFFMTVTSPLFNSSFTVGDMSCTMAIAKAIGNGQVYFKDIFEQRGLYLYLIYIASAFLPFMQAKTVLWIIETANMCGFYAVVRFINSKYGYKFKKHANLYYDILSFIAPMLFVFTASSSNMCAPEEFCMIPLAYSIYLALKFGQTKKLTYKDNLILGICMGYVIDIKYSVMMIIAGTYFAVGIYLLLKKQFKEFFKTVGIAVGGVVIGFIPAIIYFTANNAVGDWLKYYFFDNASSINFIVNSSTLGFYLYELMVVLLICVLPAIFTIKKFSKLTRWTFLSIFIFACLGIILIGRSGTSYATPLIVYLGILMTLGMPDFLHWLFNAKKYFTTPVLVIELLTTLGIALFTAQHPLYKAGMVRVPTPKTIKMINSVDPGRKPSQMIDKFGGGKILDFGIITNNIYAYNKEYPKLFYFDQTTISYKRYPESFDTQLKYIKDGIPDWLYTSYYVGVRDKNWSKKQYTKKKKYEKSVLNHMYDMNLATVTALAEHVQKHKDKYKTYNSNIDYGKNKYHIIIKMPKTAYKNYVPVFLSLYEYPESNLSLQSSSTATCLWAKKSVVTKHPELQKYVIDPANLSKTLNKYNFRVFQK